MQGCLVAKFGEKIMIFSWNREPITCFWLWSLYFVIVIQWNFKNLILHRCNRMPFIWLSQKIQNFSGDLGYDGFNLIYTVINSLWFVVFYPSFSENFQKWLCFQKYSTSWSWTSFPIEIVTSGNALSNWLHKYMAYFN